MDNLTGGNPLAHRVRVYYDGSSTIAEGMPVCYNYLTTDNWWGGSVSDEGVVTANETTAEGSHNKGKYIYVCNPICVNSTAADSTEASNIITEDGNECDNLQVGMFVSIASATDSAFDGNYKITAINTTTNAVTLEMTAAQKALVTTQTDVTFKIDNIHAFAGVVAKGGWVGKTGPQVLDIYVPNGAIVPVKTVLASTTAGRTILSVVSATQTLGNPTTDVPKFGIVAGQIDSRPVAIAAETISSAGLVLAKLDDSLFMYQGGQLDQFLKAGYAGTVNTAVNKMFLEFTQTSANCCALHYRTKLNGIGGYSDRGVYRFETILTQTASGTIYGLMSHLEFLTTESGGAYAPLKLSIRSRVVDANLSAMQNLAAINIDFILAAASGNPLSNPPARSSIIYVNTESGATQPDYLLTSELLEGVGGVATAKSGDGSGSIKIRLGGVEYWLQYWDAVA